MGPNLYIRSQRFPNRLMQLHPAIYEAKQVMLQHRKLGISPSATYALLAGCLSIGNTTSTATAKGRRILRLLKGYHSACSYQRNNRQLIEAVDEGTLFLTNFNGILEAASGWVFCRRI
uniref:MIP19311p1 n=1 Tax=Drosophila melanogaster TaxID=7227 RepID=G2J640_DROME|nr:MIP19311p1 [Drosophila melanogaster]